MFLLDAARALSLDAGLVPDRAQSEDSPGQGQHAQCHDHSQFSATDAVLFVRVVSQFLVDGVVEGSAGGAESIKEIFTALARNGIEGFCGVSAAALGDLYLGPLGLPG